MSLYDLGRGPVKLFFKLFHRIEYIGIEHFDAIDPKDGILICSNHVSNFDPPAVGAGCPRRLSFMAKEELFKVPLLKQLITKLHAFPIKRGAGDRQALKMAIKIVNEGGTLIMFPEGHRMKEGKLGKGQPGVGFITLKSNAVVVPVAIIGRFKLFQKTKIVYGQPIDVSIARAEKQKAAEVTLEIMNHIQALIDQHS
ncbi:1-acyl-sn-glycerol-3-phosphate acyltransferase [Pullulanibacillus pueri]|uniref:1-acyl-sn-glycerol-3-phosphate acyltransferase n=1 Tax=Pullulanibacillus pueri TaxID=1437324 RepID=A0A8J3EM44_9BACL|nr:lysophospholipid acyltransferase family protein [Pullulanibacillus pueri]MBM7681480.1 1-acyl-sn-glycerol-3-phosphate acyltransferase [Pullulanibacillus pueri]GGH79048.1 1-acyl-sn-glycerol-3-phosphate acyltransferase [Pullulanibacillus pueri]